MEELCAKYFKNIELLENKKKELKEICETLKKEIDIIKDKNKKVEEEIFSFFDANNLVEYIFNDSIIKKVSTKKFKPINIDIVADNIRKGVSQIDKNTDDNKKNYIIKEVVENIENDREHIISNKLTIKKK